MSTIARQYIKHTIRSNYRLLLLVIIIQILILQNLVFPITSILSVAIGENTTGHLYSLDGLLACVCIMAFCIPLYQFRYLMKRNSSDLYLSLPIKRGNFFDLQFLIGAGQLVATTLIALGCSSLLSLNYVGLFSQFFTIFILEVLGLILYSLFTWVIIKCNTFFDGILISIAYTLFPLLVMVTMYLFSDRVVGEILVSNIYGLGDVIQSDVFFLITSFLSVPFTMLAFVDSSVLPFANNAWIIVSLLLFWVVLGVCFTIFAKKAYIQRKGEQSGERTKTWMAYPIMIPLFTVCLLLIVGANLEQLVFLMFIFLGYIIMYFFAKRSLKVSAFMIIQFLCLFFFANGLERFLISNNYFGNVKETFELDDIRDNGMSITYETMYFDTNGNIDSKVKRYGSTDWYHLTKEEKQAILDFQKALLTFCDEKSNEVPLIYRFDSEGTIANISFYIRSDDTNNHSRGYAIQNEEGLAKLNDYMQRFIETGILIEQVDEVSMN